MSNKERIIEFPVGWDRPKYQMGQLVSLGWIVGIQYNPSYLVTLNGLSEGWHYVIIPSQISEEFIMLPELLVKPLSSDELRSERLLNEITILEARVSDLRKQSSIA